MRDPPRMPAGSHGDGDPSRGAGGGEITPRSDERAPPAGDAPSPRDARRTGKAPRGHNAPGESEAEQSHNASPADEGPHGHAAATPRAGETPHVLSSSRYLAWLYSPPHQQPVLAKLCEIEAEIASSLRPGLDHHVAHTRLQWWREECERCAEGRPVHPLTRALAAAYGGNAAAAAPRATVLPPPPAATSSTAGTFSPAAASSTARTFSPAAASSTAGTFSPAAASSTAGTSPPAAASPPPSNARTPLAGISGFADTAVWDLAGATFETRKELTAYCERWATAMFETAAGQNANSASNEQRSSAEHATRATQVARALQSPSEPDQTPPAATAQPLGETSRETALSWRALGAAIREVELLTDLAREAHAGRVRVPLDELDRASVDVNVVARPPWPEALATLLRERHKALRATIENTVSALGPKQQVEFRGLVVWAALAWQQSARAERALPNIISPRRYHALADGWQAWRAARRAAAGNLRLG